MCGGVWIFVFFLSSFFFLGGGFKGIIPGSSQLVLSWNELTPTYPNVDGCDIPSHQEMKPYACLLFNPPPTGKTVGPKGAGGAQAPSSACLGVSIFESVPGEA